MKKYYEQKGLNVFDFLPQTYHIKNKVVDLFVYKIRIILFGLLNLPNLLIEVMEFTYSRQQMKSNSSQEVFIIIRMESRRLLLFKNILKINYFITKENLILDDISYLLLSMDNRRAIGIKMDTKELLALNSVWSIYKSD
ncbi:unnamed protein product (macronuclear) [Paramecium tetraurelia]|uniref:Uncharacterized protein n=1 Tax=Paramecium tetraurelia TaxID=5888 RepID=A0C7P5_PARTE|nr:uncharacterized protein GSPATT00035942001 [Paramecium tetraurelia]CAK66812.1 unnamed protein product [Paramecium tetraurelia]|eukprot:XP_001434209.1 hypothetical protein (macronuclear) [Paramecium tetraurelia strain d4-2]